ncbi:hypothetical protein ACFL1T_04115, partial [Chlamydiota bacterium]
FSLNSSKGKVHALTPLKPISLEVLPHVSHRTLSENLMIPGMIISKELEDASHPEVILIRDIHCEEKAQLRIARALKELRRKYDIKRIFLEGAEGPIKTVLYESFPDETERKKVARAYVEKGYLTGAEYAAIELGFKDGLRLYGVENGNSYIENFKTFQETRHFYEKAKKLIDEIDSFIANTKKSQFSDELQKIDDSYGTLHLKGEVDLQTVFGLIGEKLEKRQSAWRMAHGEKKVKNLPQTYEELAKLYQVHIMEEAVNNEEAQQELKELISAFEKKLVREEVKKILKYSLEYRVGTIPFSAYIAMLQETYGRTDLYEESFQERYPNLWQYSVLSQKSEEMDKEKAFYELQLFLKNVREEKGFEEGVEHLMQIDAEWGLLKKMMELQSTRKDLMKMDKDTLSNRVNKFLTEISFLKKETSTNSIREYEKKLFQDVLKSAEHFYSYALQRDRILVENTVEQMRLSITNNRSLVPCVLITGGFHTEGIENILQEKGVSFITLTPLVNDRIDSSQYYKRMTKKRYDYDKSEYSTKRLAMRSKENETMRMLAPEVLLQAAFNMVNNQEEKKIRIEILRDMIGTVERLNTLLNEWMGGVDEHRRRQIIDSLDIPDIQELFEALTPDKVFAKISDLNPKNPYHVTILTQVVENAYGGVYDALVELTKHYFALGKNQQQGSAVLRNEGDENNVLDLSEVVKIEQVEGPTIPFQYNKKKIFLPEKFLDLLIEDIATSIVFLMKTYLSFKFVYNDIKRSSKQRMPLSEYIWGKPIAKQVIKKLWQGFLSTLLLVAKLFFDIKRFFVEDVPSPDFLIFDARSRMRDETLLKKLREDAEMLRALLLHESFDTGEAGAHQKAWQAVKEVYPGGMKRLVQLMINNMKKENLKALINEYTKLGEEGRTERGWGGFEKDIHKYLVRTVENWEGYFQKLVNIFRVLPVKAILCLKRLLSKEVDKEIVQDEQKDVFFPIFTPLVGKDGFKKAKPLLDDVVKRSDKDEETGMHKVIFLLDSVTEPEELKKYLDSSFQHVPINVLLNKKFLDQDGNRKKIRKAYLLLIQEKNHFLTKFNGSSRTEKQRHEMILRGSLTRAYFNHSGSVMEWIIDNDVVVKPVELIFETWLLEMNMRYDSRFKSHQSFLEGNIDKTLDVLLSSVQKTSQLNLQKAKQINSQVRELEKMHQGWKVAYLTKKSHSVNSEEMRYGLKTKSYEDSAASLYFHDEVFLRIKQGDVTRGENVDDEVLIGMFFETMLVKRMKKDVSIQDIAELVKQIVKSKDIYGLTFRELLEIVITSEEVKEKVNNHRNPLLIIEDAIIEELIALDLLDKKRILAYTTIHEKRIEKITERQGDRKELDVDEKPALLFVSKDEVIAEKSKLNRILIANGIDEKSKRPRLAVLFEAEIAIEDLYKHLPLYLQNVPPYILFSEEFLGNNSYRNVLKRVYEDMLKTKEELFKLLDSDDELLNWAIEKNVIIIPSYFSFETWIANLKGEQETMFHCNMDIIKGDMTSMWKQFEEVLKQTVHESRILKSQEISKKLQEILQKHPDYKVVLPTNPAQATQSLIENGYKEERLADFSHKDSYQSSYFLTLVQGTISEAIREDLLVRAYLEKVFLSCLKDTYSLKEVHLLIDAIAKNAQERNMSLKQAIEMIFNSRVFKTVIQSSKEPFMLLRNQALLRGMIDALIGYHELKKYLNIAFENPRSIHHEKEIEKCADYIKDLEERISDAKKAIKEGKKIVKEIEFNASFRGKIIARLQGKLPYKQSSYVTLKIKEQFKKNVDTLNSLKRQLVITRHKFRKLHVSSELHIISLEREEELILWWSQWLGLENETVKDKIVFWYEIALRIIRWCIVPLPDSARRKIKSVKAELSFYQKKEPLIKKLWKRIVFSFEDSIDYLQRKKEFFQFILNTLSKYMETNRIVRLFKQGESIKAILGMLGFDISAWEIRELKLESAMQEKMAAVVTTYLMLLREPKTTGKDLKKAFKDVVSSGLLNQYIYEISNEMLQSVLDINNTNIEKICKTMEALGALIRMHEMESIVIKRDVYKQLLQIGIMLDNSLPVEKIVGEYSIDVIDLFKVFLHTPQFQLEVCQSVANELANLYPKQASVIEVLSSALKFGDENAKNASNTVLARLIPFLTKKRWIKTLTFLSNGEKSAEKAAKKALITLIYELKQATNEENIKKLCWVHTYKYGNKEVQQIAEEALIEIISDSKLQYIEDSRETLKVLKYIFENSNAKLQQAIVDILSEPYYGVQYVEIMVLISDLLKNENLPGKIDSGLSSALEKMLQMLEEKYLQTGDEFIVFELNDYIRSGTEKVQEMALNVLIKIFPIYFNQFLQADREKIFNRNRSPFSDYVEILLLSNNEQAKRVVSETFLKLHSDKYIHEIGSEYEEILMYVATYGDTVARETAIESLLDDGISIYVSRYILENGNEAVRKSASTKLVEIIPELKKAYLRSDGVLFNEELELGSKVLKKYTFSRNNQEGITVLEYILKYGDERARELAGEAILDLCHEKLIFTIKDDILMKALESVVRYGEGTNQREAVLVLQRIISTSNRISAIKVAKKTLKEIKSVNRKLVKSIIGKGRIEADENTIQHLNVYQNPFFILTPKEFLKNTIDFAVGYIKDVTVRKQNKEGSGKSISLPQKKLVLFVLLTLLFPTLLTFLGCTSKSNSSKPDDTWDGIQTHFNSIMWDRGWPLLDLQVPEVNRLSKKAQGQALLVDKIVLQIHENIINQRNIRIPGKPITVSLISSDDKETPVSFEFAFNERQMAEFGTFYLFRDFYGLNLLIPKEDIRYYDSVSGTIYGNDSLLHLYIIDEKLLLEIAFLTETEKIVLAFENMQESLIDNGVFSDEYHTYIMKTFRDFVFTEREDGVLEVIGAKEAFPDGIFPRPHNYWIGNTAETLMLFLDWLESGIISQEENGFLRNKIRVMTKWLLEMQISTGTFLMKKGGYFGPYISPHRASQIDNNLLAVDVETEEGSAAYLAEYIKRYKQYINVESYKSFLSAAFKRRNIVLTRGYENFLGGYVITPKVVVVPIDGGEQIPLDTNDDTIFSSSYSIKGVQADGSLQAERQFDSDYITVKEIVNLRDGFQAVDIRYEYSIKAGYKLCAFSKGGTEHLLELYPWGENGIAFPMMSEDDLYYAGDFDDEWIDFTAHFYESNGVFTIFGWDKNFIGDLGKDPTYIVVSETGEENSRTFVLPPQFKVRIGDGWYEKLWTEAQLEQFLTEDEFICPGEVLQVGPASYSIFWLPIQATPRREMPLDLIELTKLWKKAKDDDKKNYLSYETDYAYTAAALSLARVYNNLDYNDQLRDELEEAIVKGAEYALEIYKKLRMDVPYGRTNPAYGIMRFYSYHVELFEQAWDITGEAKWYDALVLIADAIIDLQVKDQNDVRCGGFFQNEGEFAAILVDDIGMKLWALRVAYDLTQDPKYKYAVELCITQWLQVSDDDGLFEGRGRDNEMVNHIGQRTGYGQACMLYGLAYWRDLLPQAENLFFAGFEYFRMENVFVGLDLYGFGPQLYVGKEEPFYYGDVNTELMPILMQSIVSFRCSILGGYAKEMGETITGEEKIGQEVIAEVIEGSKGIDNSKEHSAKSIAQSEKAIKNLNEMFQKEGQRKVRLHVLDGERYQNVYFEVEGKRKYALGLPNDDGGVDVYVTEKLLKKMLEDTGMLQALLMHESLDISEEGAHARAWQEVKKRYPEGMKRLLELMIDNMEKVKNKSSKTRTELT